MSSQALTSIQVAAYGNGELVVDTWRWRCGTKLTGQLVDGDTLFYLLSTTKGFVAPACISSPIVARWTTIPHCYYCRFGVHGKAVVTVREALTHRAGVPQMPRVSPLR